MANYNCVEPAQETPADHSVVLVGADDSITFPAVDSCFAIAFVLADGKLVGGHVPTLWDAAEGERVFSAGTEKAMKKALGAAMAGCLGRIVADMNGRRGATAVTLAITLGDDDWSNHWTGILGQIGNPDEIRYRKERGPRNLIVYGNIHRIRVQAGGRGFYAAVPGSPWTFEDGARNPRDISV
jgi:hypothetical protein